LTPEELFGWEKKGPRKSEENKQPEQQPEPELSEQTDKVKI